MMRQKASNAAEIRKEKMREYRRTYYLRHRDEILSRVKAYQASLDPERLKERRLKAQRKYINRQKAMYWKPTTTTNDNDTRL